MLPYAMVCGVAPLQMCPHCLCLRKALQTMGQKGVVSLSNVIYSMCLLHVLHAYMLVNKQLVVVSLLTCDWCAIFLLVRMLLAVPKFACCSGLSC